MVYNILWKIYTTQYSFAKISIITFSAVKSTVNVLKKKIGPYSFSNQRNFDGTY